jgi:hypothetical protein
MTIIDETNQILDKVQKPSGDERWVILKNKNGERTTRTTHPQQIYMSQELTKEVFGKGNARYGVISTQKSYNLVHCDEMYKRHATDGWMHNMELLLESGLLIPDPEVRDIGGELKYILNSQMMASEGRLKPIKSGKVIEVKIDRNDAIRTLVRAEVMREPAQKVYSDDIVFDDDGLSSFRSSCRPNLSTVIKIYFRAGSDKPSDKSPNGFAVLEKLPS